MNRKYLSVCVLFPRVKCRGQKFLLFHWSFVELQNYWHSGFLGFFFLPPLEVLSSLLLRLWKMSENTMCQWHRMSTPPPSQFEMTLSSRTSPPCYFLTMADQMDQKKFHTEASGKPKSLLPPRLAERRWCVAPQLQFTSFFGFGDWFSKPTCSYWDDFVILIQSKKNK